MYAADGKALKPDDAKVTIGVPDMGLQAGLTLLALEQLSLLRLNLSPLKWARLPCAFYVTVHAVKFAVSPRRTLGDLYSAKVTRTMKLSNLDWCLCIMGWS